MSIHQGGVSPGPGTARQWLREELAHSEYHRSLAQRFLDAVRHLLSRVSEQTTHAGGIDPVVGLVLLALLGLGVALLLSRLRGNASAPSSSGAVFGPTRRTAAEHRVLAQQALATGDWDTAVVESMRATAAGLVERGLLGEDAGATAHEVTTGAARVLPELGERLGRAARAFDETRYGDRPADEATARALAALEHDVRHAVPHAASATGPVTAVPR